MSTLAIVVPCYNEAEILPQALEELKSVLDRLIKSGLVEGGSNIYCVDDGSKDATWAIIESEAKRSLRVHGIKLSGNCGHQNAIMAGMLKVTEDMVITIDADLQDDIHAIETMVRHHLAGAEIVYGVRNERKADTPFKRMTAEGYYKLLKNMGVRIIYNHADYRLLGRRAIEALREYREKNLFVRGLIPQLGFTVATVEYARKPRTAGESKYPLRKMLSLAWNGITSFSTVPLRLVFYSGLIISMLSFLSGIVIILLRLFTETTIPGWTSIIVPMCFLGGIQLISIGIIGEYIGKIYIETKARPRFHIEKEV